MTERALLVSSVTRTCAYCALDPRACAVHWEFPIAATAGEIVETRWDYDSDSDSIPDDFNTVRRLVDVCNESAVVYAMMRVRVRPTSPYYLGEAVRLPPWRESSTPVRSLTANECIQLVRGSGVTNRTGPLITMIDEHSGEEVQVLGKWSLRPKPPPSGLLEIADDVPWTPDYF